MDSSSNPVEIVDFLSDEDCESLISYYKKSPKPKRKYDFWKERVVPCTLVTSIKIRRLVEEIQYRIIGNTCRSYDEEYLYPDFSNLVYWGSGMELKPHIDNMHINDPLRKHDTPHRDYSAVICLNDGYEGGHTIFPEQDVEYTGKKGRLIIFPSGGSHPHGVTEVTSGERYTFSMWMTKKKEKMNCITYGLLVQPGGGFRLKYQTP